MDCILSGHFWPPTDTPCHIIATTPRQSRQPDQPADDLADLRQATTYWHIIATGDECYDCFQRLLADAAMIVTRDDLADVDRQHRIFRYLEGRLQDCHVPTETYDLCHKIVIGAYRARCVALTMEGSSDE